MPLNTKQMNHVLDRLEQGYARRKAGIHKNHRTQEQVRLKPSDALAALNAGRFTATLEPDADEKFERRYAHYNALAYVKITLTDEQEAKHDEAAIAADMAALDAEYERVKDEVLLGDNEAALKLVRAFLDAA